MRQSAYTSGVKTLVIDSNAHDRAMLLECLHQAGYQPIAVASRRQVRKALRQRSFDLVLLDLNLPDGDGLKLCKELRERLGLQVVIIVVSHDQNPRARIVAFELGADDYLPKPWEGDELLWRIIRRLARAGTWPGTDSIDEL